MHTLRDAVFAGLMRYGLSEASARNLAGLALSGQPEEWDRITARCERGEVSRIYVFSVHVGESHLRAFVYAPGDVDNSATIAKMLGTRSASGWVGEGEAGPQIDANPVAMFDVAREVCAALRIAK